MSEDIVTMLRREDDWLTHKAADEIERLRLKLAASEFDAERTHKDLMIVRRERNKLRAALEPFARVLILETDKDTTGLSVLVRDLRRARAALRGDGPR